MAGGPEDKAPVPGVTFRPKQGSLIADSIPAAEWPTHEEHGALEHTDDRQWPDRAWKELCMASDMAGNVDLLAKVIKKEKVTAAQGKRCLVLVEMGRDVASLDYPAKSPRGWNTKVRAPDADYDHA